MFPFLVPNEKSRLELNVTIALRGMHFIDPANSDTISAYGHTCCP